MYYYTFTRKSHNLDSRCSYYSVLLYIFCHKYCTRSQWKKDIEIEEHLHTSYGHDVWTALKKEGYIESFGKKIPTYAITQKGKDFLKYLFQFQKAE